MAALEHGLQRLAEPFPLSLRLIRDIHRVLLSKGRSSDRDPGNFRRSQNWIGGSRPGNAVFVPPPPEHVVAAMGHLELFLHNEPERTPILVKAALSHVQFETIHPFLDGNGRVGRLLMTLLLYAEKVLKEPMLYLSLFFKTHRQRYYDLLNQVRQTGDWEAWLDFFAEAVTETANQAVDSAQQLVRLAEVDRLRINELGRVSGSVIRVHRALLQRPITSARWVSEQTQLSPATVNTCLGHLERLHIVRELTGQRRNRLFNYTRYIEIMNQGTETPD